ncbi:protease complex subunit PrcB family protein [Paenibacillus tarimensis]
MKKKPIFIVFLALTLLFALGQTVFAFSDTSTDPNSQKIAELKKRGILNGHKDGTFLPGGKLTNAAGVALIVKGMDLNLNDIQFIKEPKASDYFTNVKDNAWYSEAFVIAHLNGLDLPKDIDPSAAMTREQFAHSLFLAMMTKGDYAFIKLYMLIEDEADITPAYMNSVQKLLISDIIKLDKKQMFYPKEAVKRSEAAGWLHDAIIFVETTPTIPEIEPFPLSDVKLESTKVNDDVLEVTVSAQAPHPGYGIQVTSIMFEGKRAIIYVDAVQPDPDKMYAQVITEVKATTYIGSEYEAVLADLPAGGGVSGSPGSDSPVSEHAE